jgi:G3E family GTPase
VDALQGSDQLDRHPESRKQVTIADRLVLTKTDLVGPAVAARLRERLQQLNPLAEIITSRSDLALGMEILDASPRKRQYQADEDSHPATGCVALSFAEPVDWVAFSVWLSLLLHAHGEAVLRVKGLLEVEGTGPVAINAVQHVVHRPEHLGAWPDGPDGPSGPRASRLVLIARELDAGAIEGSLRRFLEAA